MSRVRGGLGVAVALATFAAFSVPALASSVPTLPDAAVTGVSNRAVCTPGPAGTARCHAHVVTGPDRALYVSTSNRDGRNTPVADDERILRIVGVQ